VNSLLRLCHRLDKPLNANRCGSIGYRRHEGYMVQLGCARTLCFSATTADLLLGGDES
jgi:hypothetical protein